MSAPYWINFRDWKTIGCCNFRKHLQRPIHTTFIAYEPHGSKNCGTKQEYPKCKSTLGAKLRKQKPMNIQFGLKSFEISAQMVNRTRIAEGMKRTESWPWWQKRRRTRSCRCSIGDPRRWNGGERRRWSRPPCGHKPHRQPIPGCRHTRHSYRPWLSFRSRVFPNGGESEKERLGWIAWDDYGIQKEGHKYWLRWRLVYVYISLSIYLSMPFQLSWGKRDASDIAKVFVLQLSRRRRPDAYSPQQLRIS